MGSRTRTLEYHEGLEAGRQFERSLGRVLSVSKDELAKREAAYQKYRSTRPHRGPPKKSTS